MQQFAETGLLENLKEKMANPILFTYFWVFCSWNIQHITYFLFMPRLVSDKFDYLADKWDFGSPIIIAFVIIMASPWLNNVVEIWRQVAHRWLQTTLKKSKFKALVEDEVHQRVVNQLIETRASLASSEQMATAKNETINALQASMDATEKAEAITTEKLSKKNNDLKKLRSDMIKLLEISDVAISLIRHENLTAYVKGEEVVANYEKFINSDAVPKNFYTPDGRLIGTISTAPYEDLSDEEKITSDSIKSVFPADGLKNS